MDRPWKQGRMASRSQTFSDKWCSSPCSCPTSRWIPIPVKCTSPCSTGWGGWCEPIPKSHTSRPIVKGEELLNEDDNGKGERLHSPGSAHCDRCSGDHSGGSNSSVQELCGC